MSTTQGRPGAPVLEVGGQLLGDRLRPDPHLHLDAGRPERGDPAAGDLGVGVLDGHHHPAGCPTATMASVQGGVRPWWAHGSSVT